MNSYFVAVVPILAVTLAFAAIYFREWIARLSYKKQLAKELNVPVSKINKVIKRIKDNKWDEVD